MGILANTGRIHVQTAGPICCSTGAMRPLFFYFSFGGWPFVVLPDLGRVEPGGWIFPDVFLGFPRFSMAFLKFFYRFSPWIFQGIPLDHPVKRNIQGLRCRFLLAEVLPWDCRGTWWDARGTAVGLGVTPEGLGSPTAFFTKHYNDARVC